MDNLLTSQPHIIDFLTKSLHGDHLVHAYLFFGGNHSEKIAAAKYLAKLVLGNDEITARLVENDEHANVITIRPDGKNIKKEQIVFLKTEISKKSVENKPKIYMIDGADKMSISATNSLLKFLEEPAPHIHIILISPSKEVLLPTITSRTVNLNFKGKRLVGEISSEVIDVIRQLESAKMSPQIITAKNPDIFKDNLLDFLNGYQAYYQNVMEGVLGISSDENFDKEMLAQSVRSNDIKSCTKKLRAIEGATRHLQANMNVQLCVDKLWLDF
jgi:DNA polymerase III gamma/tau subunit